MEKISDDVFEKIKNFHHYNLTKRQKLLIDKLILNEELKNCYKKYGLCKECKQPNTSKEYDGSWCQPCSSKRFQENFKNWTSGNYDVDELIKQTQLEAKDYRQILEWIEYDRFENVEHLQKGGFGTTYKAIWKDGYIEIWDSKNNQWKRSFGNELYALKCLHNSQDITAEFLSEIKSHKLVMSNSGYVPWLFGITKNPKTNEFMMVMNYAKNGSLRQHLNNNFKSIKWREKLGYLHDVTIGLKDIHKNKIIHRDFHCGNILSWSDNKALIADLGLCQPANVKPSQNDDCKTIYGVLPYVAPEVLRGKEYTQASDIYGFGIIAYEVCTGLPPYHDMAHDELLAIRICQGLRPKSDYKVPQLILDVINQCWDADPLKRPKAEELSKLYIGLCGEDIDNQIKEADEINEKLSSSSLPYTGSALSYTTDPQAIYTSRLLSFKDLPEPKNSIDNNIVGIEYSESLKIDFTKLNVNSKDESNSN